MARSTLAQRSACALLPVPTPARSVHLSAPNHTEPSVTALCLVSTRSRLIEAIGCFIQSPEKLFNGEWVEYGKKMFVLDGFGKRYCYDTLELAMNSFMKRKEYQARCCRNALEIADFILNNKDKTYNLTQEDVILSAEHITSRYTSKLKGITE